MNEKRGKLIERLLKKSMGLFLLGLMTVLLPNYSHAIPPLTSEFTAGPDNIAVFAKGVGLFSNSSGTIDLDIPGAPIIAFLSWQYRGTPANNEISFDDGSGAVTVFGTLSTEEAEGSNNCFFADITDLISSGPKTYTVSGLDDSVRHPGAGILVVAEDSSFPSQSIEIKAGCDFFFFSTGGHENSEIITFDFDSDTESRLGKVTFFVGDAQTDTQGIRGNECIYFPDFPGGGQTTLGHDVTGLVANNGKAWDTFGQNSGVMPADPGVNPTNDPDFRGQVIVPPGAESASFQCLSVNSGLFGISAVVSMAAFEIPDEPPPPVLFCGPSTGKQPKPNAITLRYTGEDCSADNNTQGGKSDCNDKNGGLPVLAINNAPANLKVAKDASKIDPDMVTVNAVGDTVTFFSQNGTKLPSEVKLKIYVGGTELQEVKIHTSCSAPLQIGDQFGSLILVNVVPEP